MPVEPFNAPVAIIIVGPTASGKTTLAIRLAEHFGTSIISADSRQCFRELNIGVAKPGPEDLKKVKHYFIDTHSVTEKVDAAVFEQESLSAAAEIFLQHRLAIVCGGTGLYVKTFCDGIDEIPPVDPEIRKKVRDSYALSGLSHLQQWLNETDPVFYHERKNPQRPFRVIKIGCTCPREELYQRISERVDKMKAMGLVEEVRSLQAFRDSNALQTVGYQELFEYFDEKISLEDAINKIKQHTRNYAKRQITWFSKDTTINWLNGEEVDRVISFLNANLSKI
jgi:tRNA dimethylallyltransferase